MCLITSTSATVEVIWLFIVSVVGVSQLRVRLEAVCEILTCSYDEGRVIREQSILTTDAGNNATNCKMAMHSTTRELIQQSITKPATP